VVPSAEPPASLKRYRSQSQVNELSFPPELCKVCTVIQRNLSQDSNSSPSRVNLKTLNSCAPVCSDDIPGDPQVVEGIEELGSSSVSPPQKNALIDKFIVVTQTAEPPFYNFQLNRAIIFAPLAPHRVAPTHCYSVSSGLPDGVG
jgi:hypothetical protein